MPVARITSFLFLTVVLLGGVNVYVHRRVAKALRLSRRGRRVLAGGLASVPVLMLVERFVEAFGPAHFARALGFLSWDSELALVVSALVLLAVDGVRAVARLASGGRAAREIKPILASEAAPRPVAPSADEDRGAPDREGRRDFLQCAAVGGAFLVGGGVAGYAGLFGRVDYVVEEVAIRIPGLSPRLDGLTIVQLSDVHIGLFVGEPEMRSAFELVQRARPDLIVLTGDLVDHDVRMVPVFGEFVARLSRLARFGVSVIPGNHDYYTGVDAVLAAASGAGASVLRNAGRMIGDAGGRFALLGVDDVQGRHAGLGPDLALATQATEGLADDVPRILLCHNPVFFPEAAGKVALQLSGHTHGGQVNLVVRPADLLLPFGYVSGLYQRGGSTLYVNRGFGTAGPPARIGSAPEVTRIVLVSA